MRKKSHIKLASVIFDILDTESFRKYGLYFQVGAILPDIVPTFLWKKHRIDTTKKEFKRAIYKFLSGATKGRLYSLRAGVITHYLSDYFTFPHNKECKWGLLRHNLYEGKQLKQFKLLKKEDILNLHPFIQNIKSLDDLFEVVQMLHHEYLERVQNVIDNCLFIDLEYIEYVSLLVMEVLTLERSCMVQFT